MIHLVQWVLSAGTWLLAQLQRFGEPNCLYPKEKWLFLLQQPPTTNMASASRRYSGARASNSELEFLTGCIWVTIATESSLMLQPCHIHKAVFHTLPILQNLGLSRSILCDALWWDGGWWYRYYVYNWVLIDLFSELWTVIYENIFLWMMKINRQGIRKIKIAKSLKAEQAFLEFSSK